MKDKLVKVRVSSQAWQRSANELGLSLSAFVRRAVEETRKLNRSLELAAEDARQRRAVQEAAELEREYVPVAQRPKLKQGSREARPRMTVGDALRWADPGRG